MLQKCPMGRYMDSTMHLAQFSTVPRENFLNSSHISLKILFGEMLSRLRTSRQELGELLSLLC